MSSKTTTTTEYSEWDARTNAWVPKSKEVKEEIYEDSGHPYPTGRDLQPLAVPSWPQRGTFPYSAPLVTNQAVLDCSSRPLGAQEDVDYGRATAFEQERLAETGGR